MKQGCFLYLAEVAVAMTRKGLQICHNKHAKDLLISSERKWPMHTSRLGLVLRFCVLLGDSELPREILLTCKDKALLNLIQWVKSHTKKAH
jgi:hypothetical protein